MSAGLVRYCGVSGVVWGFFTAGSSDGFVDMCCRPNLGYHSFFVSVSRSFRFELISITFSEDRIVLRLDV